MRVRIQILLIATHELLTFYEAIFVTKCQQLSPDTLDSKQKFYFYFHLFIEIVVDLYQSKLSSIDLVYFFYQNRATIIVTYQFINHVVSLLYFVLVFVLCMYLQRWRRLHFSVQSLNAYRMCVGIVLLTIHHLHSNCLEGKTKT